MYIESLGTVMTDDAASVETPPEEEGRKVTIESRYGPVEVNLDNTLLFPQGLLGMPTNTDYCIAHFPSPNMEQFKLLQNLNDHELCFAVLPIAPDSEVFEQSDIEEACQITDITREHLVILAIISVQRSPIEVRVTANMRAPLLIDSEKKLGVQYVFPSNKYDIRHLLSQTKKEG